MFLLCSSLAFAQVNDAGLWTSFSVEKKITPAFSAELSQEFRLNDNFHELGEYFTDLGFSYKLNKNIHISLDYRFTNKRKKEDYYSTRHRYYVDISYRRKFKPVMVQFRTRFQSQYKDWESGPESGVAEYYSRNKLTVKRTFHKRYTPFVATEIFLPLNKPDGFYMDAARYSAGIDYEINRMHSFELFYLIEREYNVKNPLTSYVIGLGYQLTF